MPKQDKVVKIYETSYAKGSESLSYQSWKQPTHMEWLQLGKTTLEPVSMHIPHSSSSSPGVLLHDRLFSSTPPFEVLER